MTPSRALLHRTLPTARRILFPSALPLLQHASISQPHPPSPSPSSIITTTMSRSSSSTRTQARSGSRPPSALQDQLSTLSQYSACDIADALLALKIPGAGFLPDFTLAPRPTSLFLPKLIVAPASTVLFAPKNDDAGLSQFLASNIPPGTHWVDLTVPDTVLVIAQPEGQKNAVLGGIMAARAKVVGVKGIVVRGRVRDVGELEETGLPIWSRGTSIVGAGAESKPYAVQVPLLIDGTTITPGDIIFGDPINGVAVIPRNKLSEVLSILPGLMAADDKVKADVKKGVPVQEAFNKHRL